MKKFYDRKRELGSLEKGYLASQQQLVVGVISGRRRVGKTALIRKFCEPKKTLYFYVTKKSSPVLLQEFSAILQELFPALPSRFGSWDDFFNSMFLINGQESVVVVFDEFQNFIYVDASVFSILQKYIDKYKYDCRLYLVLIGSIQSLMDKIFLEKEPLYGRIDHRIDLQGFSFETVCEICDDHGVADLDKVLDYYCIFNGIAKYYDILEKYSLFQSSIPDMLTELCFTKDAPFYREGEALLVEEFGRDYERYFDILTCVSTGKTKANEIADVLQLPVTTISKYMSVLIDRYRLIERIPLWPKIRDNRYHLMDHFLRFWFAYVYKNLQKIEIDASVAVIRQFVATFPSHKGHIFEEVARSKLFYFLLTTSAISFKIDFLAIYADKTDEFDLYFEDRKSLLLGEIKLSPESVTMELLGKIDLKINKMNPMNIKKNAKIILTFNPIQNINMINALQKGGFYYYSFNDLLDKSAVNR